jgi:hypothetical protein
LLLDHDGHINCEYAGSTYTVMYLYKYLFKGNKKVQCTIHRRDGSEDVIRKDDEINLYIRGRMLCAMDAMWRVLGYQTYPPTSPSVQHIKIKDPALMENLISERKMSDLLVYFKRPQEFHHMLYTEFFKQFIYSFTAPRGAFTIANFAIYNITESLPFRIEKNLYVFERRNPSSTIVRMGHVPLKAGESFYQRLLLRFRPCISYKDLRTINDITYNTFQMAALAGGYVRDGDEAVLAFRQSFHLSTPAELRGLFVLMTLQGMIVQ